MFKVSSREIADIEPFKILPKKSGETYTVGEALTLASAGVTKCGATEIPQYICIGQGDENGLVCIPVLTTTEFEVGYTAAPTVGTKVTLHTDGLQVTATTTSGVFAVVSVNASTGKARGYFK
ncbi:MAG: hypothetical protein VB047_11985 [Anaerotignum propionicum]|uniref:hypothetical protein n=1 Tax=Anaerotignum propionicum TaxID=28446 RepID=UPI002B201207|nr:hypothetical protein [Anaerotignum propionicum]MEA5058258.1 hypothetical protein [Anaerotignum propionicum]